VSYTVAVGRRVQAALRHLQPRDDARIRRALQGLAEEPRPPGCRKLRDREGWRIRIGEYRVIYEIDDVARLVRVLEIGHRRDVYR
jgi:mRNA interferase RelE/StbE